MMNLVYFSIIAIVISATVYLVNEGINPNPLKKALWTLAQLVGGICALAVVVYLLTNG